MLTELREDAIVASFKKELPTIKFIDASLHKEIGAKLDILANGKSSRHEKVEAAKLLWRQFFSLAFRSISNNVRGQDQLFAYYDELCTYENLLFAIDENHRDHVIHVIWVMLLGYFLQTNFPPFTPLLESYKFCSDDLKDPPMIKLFETYNKRLTEHVNSIWCLAALTHDLGYPIQKTRTANGKMAKMVSNFGILEGTNFNYTFGPVHETAISTLLNILSTQFVMKDNEVSMHYSPGMRLEFAQSLEQLDHGIMSAYLLMAKLDWICEALSIDSTMPVTRPKVPIVDILVGRILLSEWLEVIAAHTSRFRYWRHLQSLGFHLFLCDQLEEFSRYSVDLKTQEWINVGCRTKVEHSGKVIELQHELDNPNAGDNIELFFKKRVKALRERVELHPQKPVEKIRLICSDIRGATPVKFSYEKYRDLTPNEMVHREPGKSTNDILKFLDGVIDLK